MKSISIVYNKPKNLKPSQSKEQGESQIRKTVNNFYTKIVDKDFLKNDHALEIERIQTARTSRYAQRRNVISSLSISSIPTNHSIITGKTMETKKINPQTIFNIRRAKEPKKFFSLRLPENRSEQTQNLIPRRKINKISKHSKVKLLTKIKCQKQATLVLSVDFIFNEFNFWGEQFVEEASVQTWRILSPLANIIWVVRNEMTLKKLLTFSQSKGLRLDGVVQIQPNKKQSLTISFAALESEAKFSRCHKLVFVFCLKSEKDYPISQYDLRFSLPIVSLASSFVHFVRIDMKDRYRIRSLKKVVSKELPEPFNVNYFLMQKMDNNGKNKIRQATIQTQENDEPVDPTEKLEKTRQRLLSQFEQSFGLKTKIQGDSLSYIIGDILKRNYNIAKQIFTNLQDFERIKQNKKQHLQALIEKSDNELKKRQYARPVYVW